MNNSTFLLAQIAIPKISCFTCSYFMKIQFVSKNTVILLLLWPKHWVYLSEALLHKLMIKSEAIGGEKIR